MSADHARLFVALDLPGEVRRELAGWAASLAATRPALRPVPAESLHVTLAFLGNRPLRDADALGGLVDDCAGGPPPLATAGVAWLPPRRPRVLGVDIADRDGALAGLQRRVAQALVAQAAHAPERRPFRPHVTVARVRPGQPLHAHEIGEAPALEFTGTAVTLYRSWTRPGGARYEALSRSPL